MMKISSFACVDFPACDRSGGGLAVFVARTVGIRTRYVEMSLLTAVILSFACAANSHAATVTLSIPKLESKAGDEIEIPIDVKGAKGMAAIQLVLTYDSKVLEVVHDPSDPEKSLARGKIVPENSLAKLETKAAGRLPIVLVCGVDPNQKRDFAIEEDGKLLGVRFRVIGQGGQKSSLGMEKVSAFHSSDIDMLVKSEPGEVIVTAAFPWWWLAALVGLLVLISIIFLLRPRSRAVVASSPQPPRRK